MKFNSYLMACALSMALVATSCGNDEFDLTNPTPATDSVEAYFSDNEVNTFDVGEDDSQVSVMLYRASTEGELIVPVTVVNPDASLFTVPQTVTFADGSASAVINIDFVSSNLVPSQPYEFEFTVGDGITTPYFTQKGTATITYFPWVDVVGPNGEETGIMFDVAIRAIWNISNWDGAIEVQVQQSPAIPGLYRIVNPYNSYPVNQFNFGKYGGGTTYLYINASDASNVFMCSPNGDALANGKPYLFNTMYEVNGESYFIVTGKYNFYLAKGDNADKNYKDFAGQLKNGVISFADDAFLVTTVNELSEGFYGSRHEFKLLLPGAEDESEDGNWEDLGTGTMTDGYLLSWYDEAPETYSVEIQVNGDDNNLIRLVNPFRADVHPFGGEFDEDVNIQIDLTDPDCVFIPTQSTGWVDVELGELYILNAAYNFKAGNKTNAQIIAAGYNDTYANGVITFAAGHLAYYWPEYNEDNLYMADNPAVTTIQLPDATQTSSVKAVKRVGITKVGNNGKPVHKLSMPAKKNIETRKFMIKYGY